MVAAPDLKRSVIHQMDDHGGLDGAAGGLGIAGLVIACAQLEIKIAVDRLPGGGIIQDGINVERMRGTLRIVVDDLHGNAGGGAVVSEQSECWIGRRHGVGGGEFVGDAGEVAGAVPEFDFKWRFAGGGTLAGEIGGPDHWQKDRWYGGRGAASGLVVDDGEVNH